MISAKGIIATPALALLAAPLTAEAHQVREIDQCANNLVSPTLTITRVGR